MTYEQTGMGDSASAQRAFDLIQQAQSAQAGASGMVRPSSWMVPVSQAGRPQRPPAPPYPSLWRGNFSLCKAAGGLVSWGPRSFRGLPVVAPPRPIEREVVFGQPTSAPPAFVTPRAPALRRCYQSGMSRVLETTRPPSTSLTDVSIMDISYSSRREYENCCYSETFIQQKLAENQAKLTVYAAQMQVYRNSPAYKAYEEEAKAWEAQRRYEVAMQRRAQALARGVATTTPGDSCSPPDGGFVGKFPFPVPRTEVGRMEQSLAFARLREAGCESQERLFDMENMEVCCPSGVQVGPPVPPVPPVPAPTPAVVQQSPRYFGFTVMQLAMVGVGGIALYALLKR